MASLRQRNVPRVRPSTTESEALPKRLADIRDFSSLRRWIQYWMLDPLAGATEFSVYYLFRIVPIDLCSAAGAMRGRYQGKARRAAQGRAYSALTLAAPGISEEQASQIVARLHRNSGRALLETLIMDRIWDDDRIDIHPCNRLQNPREPQISRIFVSVHIGNLGDLLGYCLMQLTKTRGMTISRLSPNRFRQRLSEKLRAKHGATVLAPGLKAARQLVQHLREPGNCVLIHLDEARGRQIYFPTFGRPLPYGSNLSLAIRLSAYTGALLVPVYMTRMQGARFKLNILDPIAPPPADDQGAQLAIARRLDGVFGKLVREHLDDWQQLFFLRA